MKPLVVSDIDCAQLHRLYVDEGLSCRLVGQQIGLAASNVHSRLKLCGISRRTPSPGPPDKYAYDKEFWESWHPTMAWVLGLVFSDGSVTKHGVILCQKDDALLWKMNRLGITSAEPIHYKSGACSTIRLGSQWLHDLLTERYGCTSNKSRTMLWPDPPAECLSHFVRGLWDGDGNINRQGKRSFQLAYTSGSQSFVYSFREALRTGYVREYVGKYKPYWRLTIGARDAIRALQWMYTESTESTRLARKYMIVKDVLTQS